MRLKTPDASVFLRLALSRGKESLAHHRVAEKKRMRQRGKASRGLFLKSITFSPPLQAPSEERIEEGVEKSGNQK